MIPKIRAWDVLAEEMIDEILMISFLRKEIIGKFSNGYISIPLKFEDKRNGEDVILMQSTGILDKNSQEIFEGDIIDTTDYEGGLASVGNPFVTIERDVYGFIVTGDFPNSPITIKDFEDGRKFAGVKVSIVGNIYENPELVEGNV